MAEASERWRGSKQFWWASPEVLVELFAITNLGFLTFDIYLAHSVNQFRNPAEYVPLIFSACAPLLLILALSARHRWPAVWKYAGHLVGWAAVLVGLSGVIFHLQAISFMSALCEVSPIRRRLPRPWRIRASGSCSC